MSNRGVIRTQCRSIINEPDPNNTHLTDSDLNSLIDQSILFTAAFIQYPRKFWTQQVTVDTAAYTLPTDFVSALLVYFGDPAVNNDVRPISVVSEETLRSIYPGWLDTTSGTQGRPRFAMFKTRTSILLQPRPTSAEATTGKKIHMNYVYAPAALASDSDSPDLPVPFHDILQHYVAHLAYVRLQVVESAVLALKNFSDKVNAIKAEVTREAKELSGWEWAFPLELDGDEGQIINP